MNSDDLEREFWLHFREVISSFRTLEYKSKQKHLDLEDEVSGLESQRQVPAKGNLVSRILRPLALPFLSTIEKNLRKLLKSIEQSQARFVESTEERQVRLKIQLIIIEDVLARIKAIVNGFDTMAPEALENSVEEIILTLFFYIDRYGRNLSTGQKFDNSSQLKTFSFA